MIIKFDKYYKDIIKDELWYKILDRILVACSFYNYINNNKRRKISWAADNFNWDHAEYFVFLHNVKNSTGLNLHKINIVNLMRENLNDNKI